MSTTHHSQTNEQSKRTNQIVEIALRFFLIENSDANWVNATSLIQASLNNFFNVAIELLFNRITYEFKIKNILFFFMIEKFIKNS
jgi:hypothetical protein